jgi:replicative DNA helicase
MFTESEPDRERRGRVPPQDTEAERSVLGAMLLEESAVSEMMALLCADDFYRPAHARIFEAMTRLYERSEPLDEITVSSALSEAGHLETVGGQSALAALTESVPTAANVAHYARIVRSRALTRRLITVATTIAAQAYEGTHEIDQLLDQAEAKIFEITSSREQRAFSSLKDIVKEAFKQVEKLFEQKQPITGVSSGYTDLDRITSGFQPADLIIVAGRPSMGKTAFALGVAQNAAQKHKTPVAVFSLEMSKEQLVMRMLCSEARIDSQRLRGGMLRDADWPKLARAAGVLAEAPIFIDDTGSISILEMRAKARRLQAERGLGLIVVDYLQLMRGRSGQEGREREISEISRGLKALAKELGVPVIALSQLNRSLEARQDKRPMLSDLRESGAIEQDADVIAFVYRDEYYNPDSEQKGKAEVIIGKQRNGPTDSVLLRFHREYTKFDNIQQTPGTGGSASSDADRDADDDGPSPPPGSSAGAPAGTSQPPVSADAQPQAQPGAAAAGQSQQAASAAPQEAHPAPAAPANNPFASVGGVAAALMGAAAAGQPTPAAEDPAAKSAPQAADSPARPQPEMPTWPPLPPPPPLSYDPPEDD